MNDPLLSKSPPHNLETEESVLSSLFINNKGFDEIYIEPSDFYKSAHKVIFNAMLTLRSKKEPVDLVTIGHYLQDNGKLEEIGGGSFLSSISDSAPDALNIAKYAQDIKELSVLRELILVSSNILERSMAGGDCSEILSYAQKVVLNIQNSKVDDDIRPIGDFIYNQLDEIEKYQTSDELRGLTIGLPFIDKVLDINPNRGDLIYIGAHTGTGKTSFALSIAKRFAEKYNVKTAFLSLEMEMSPLTNKCLAIEADVNNMKFNKKGKLKSEDFERLVDSARRIADIPLYIDDLGRNIEDVKRICRKLKRDGFGVIIIDQMSHIVAPGTKDELARYTHNSNQLAMLKKELRMPIIALSQLKRTADIFNPIKQDLKHSGSLENDADAIILLSEVGSGLKQTIVVKPDKVDYRYKPIKINCVKNRNGAVGFDAGDYFVINRGMFLLGG